MQESACRLEHPSAAKFRENVMAGEWERVKVSFFKRHHAVHTCVPDFRRDSGTVKLETDSLCFCCLEGWCDPQGIEAIDRKQRGAVAGGYLVNLFSLYCYCISYTTP